MTAMLRWFLIVTAIFIYGSEPLSSQVEGAPTGCVPPTESGPHPGHPYFTEFSAGPLELEQLPRAGRTCVASDGGIEQFRNVLNLHLQSRGGVFRYNTPSLLVSGRITSLRIHVRFAKPDPGRPGYARIPQNSLDIQEFGRTSFDPKVSFKAGAMIGGSLQVCFASCAPPRHGLGAVVTPE